MTTALVVGFGPFPGAPSNPSAELARRVGRRRRPAIADVRCVPVVVPTTYAAVVNELSALIRRHDPVIVLFFGLATRSKHVRVETRAVNVASTAHPDAAGMKLKGREILRGAPTALPVRAPVQRLLAAVRPMATVRPSRDAGRYLCNAALFTCLAAAQGSDRRRSVAFVHIPYPRARRRAGGMSRAKPTMAALVRAGEAALVALLAEARRG